MPGRWWRSSGPSSSHPSAAHPAGSGRGSEMRGPPRSTRRRFLGDAARGAILAGAAPAVLRAGTPPGETIQAAIIGTGGRSRVFFDPGKGASIAAVCDVDSRRLGEAAAELEKVSGRMPAKHADFRRILDDRSIDAVFVATPHHWHGPIAVRALVAGKDVYVEKPASRS